MPPCPHACVESPSSSDVCKKAIKYNANTKRFQMQGAELLLSVGHEHRERQELAWH